jgi:hypothetical protein
MHLRRPPRRDEESTDSQRVDRSSRTSFPVTRFAAALSALAIFARRSRSFSASAQ